MVHIFSIKPHSYRKLRSPNFEWSIFCISFFLMIIYLEWHQLFLPFLLKSENKLNEHKSKIALLLLQDHSPEPGVSYYLKTYEVLKF